MYPNQDNPQNQNQADGQQTTDSAAWDFLNTVPDVAPPKQSIFKRYKKLILVAGISLFLLFGLSIAALLTEPASEKASVVQTNVPLSNYSGQVFSMSHAQSLRVNIDEKPSDDEGWLLQFSEDSDTPSYDVSVWVTASESPYSDGPEAVLSLVGETDTEPTNIVTSEVSLAGVTTQKTVGEFADTNGTQKYVVYASAAVNGRFVTASATYPKDNLDIHNSFDAMISTIVLK